VDGRERIRDNESLSETRRRSHTVGRRVSQPNTQFALPDKVLARSFVSVSGFSEGGVRRAGLLLIKPRSVHVKRTDCALQCSPILGDILPVS